MQVPEICRFYGIVIKMYFADHAPPHFHAGYAEHEVRIAINTMAVIAGRYRLAQWAWSRSGRPSINRNFKRCGNVPAT